MGRVPPHKQGRLAFGTIDSFLLWRLTGGKVHATDATNAARTLLMDIDRGSWDAELCDLFRVPAALLPELRDCAGDFGTTNVLGAPIRILRRGRRPAGGDGGAGLLCARNDEIDLRHRLLCAAQYRARAGRLAQSPAHDHCLSARRRAHLCARGRDFRCRRRGAVAARRAQAHRGCARSERACRSGRSRRRGLSGAGLCRAWRALVGRIGARRGLRAHAQVGRAPSLPVRPSKRSATRRAISWKQCARIGRLRQADTVLRVDGGMAASDIAMQFLADILGAPVDRPAVMETTALGAAYLAGHAAGLCPDFAGFAAMWKCERRFQPGMDAATRERKWRGWRDAVERTLSHGCKAR